MATKKAIETETAVETAAVTEKPITDAQIDAEAEKTGDVLRAGAKVRIKIPEDKLNPKDTTVPVCVNGHLYRIQRGQTVEVPEVVADILHGAGYI